MPPTVDAVVRLPAGVRLPERYAIRRRIARGGMASVWCAHDRILGRSVAIKLLCESYARDEAAIRRFKREARAAARLSGHPNVVTIYDVGEAPDGSGEPACAFIVMEYLAGGTVADALRVGEASPDDAVRWITEAASALDYAHAKGVVHRDIKPANFLLDGRRKLHVADFGIASLGTEETITAHGEMMGTAAYLAPERAVGENATAASDLYSLAVAAYELLAGQRPFITERFTEQMRHHVETPPPPASSRNPDLSPEIDRVLDRGLAKQPERRWPTASAFADAIAEAMAPRVSSRTAPFVALAGVAAASSPAGGRPRRPAGSPAIAFDAPRRGPRVAVLAAMLAVVALVGVAAALAGSGASGPHTSMASVSRARSTAGLPGGRHHAGGPQHAATAQPTTSAQASPATPQPGTTTATPPTGSADALEVQGHSLINSGNYAQAIPVLRQAVSSAPPSSLTYAYALYDLGHALRLSGDPQAAVPVLYRRLQIPDQTDVVRQELQLALQALGQHYRGSAGTPAPTGGDHGRGPAGNGPPGQGRGGQGD